MTDLSLWAIAETITFHPLLVAAPASLVLQLVGLAWLRGFLNSLTLILLVVTVSVCALAAAAYVFDPKNLWQLVLGIPGPPMLVLTAGVLVMGLITSPRTARSAVLTT